jgi:protein ImuB
VAVTAERVVRPLRYLVVQLPAFRLERCGYEADDCAALIAEVKNAPRIVSRTPAAQAVGLEVGMTASEARALVPGVVLEPLDPVGEAQDRAALVRAFTALSDRVVAPWEDALTLEISRTTRVFGSEEAVLGEARRLAQRLGHHCRITVADDPLAALALAAWSGHDVQVPRGGTAEALAGLPIEALRPHPDLRAALRAVGVVRVSQLARLDPASVAGRYGPEGVRLHDLARGRVPPDRIDWREVDPEAASVRAPMAGATSTLQLQFVLPGLLGELSQQLAQRDQAVVRLGVVLRMEPRSTLGELPGADRVSITVRVGRPTRDPVMLERLVRRRLEGLKLSSPVDEILLEADEVVPELGWQPGLTERSEAREPLPDLLARLSDHLGDAALVAPVCVEAWRPEAAWRAERFPRASIGARVDRRAEALASDDPVALQQAWEWELESPRPTRLLREPHRLEVRWEGGEPAAVRLPRGWAVVERSSPVERLVGEWWDPQNAFDRDYRVLRVDGRDLWMYAEGGHCWLHGWFD